VRFFFTSLKAISPAWLEKPFGWTTLRSIQLDTVR
jgi:hypothetical protein